jgi:hypothetical protein
VVIRDNTDKCKQDIFDELYASMQYWVGPEIVASRGMKLNNLNWDASKSSKIWELFEQGAILTDGHPVIYCVLCFKVYNHSVIGGTSTAQTHFKRERHMAKARDLLFRDSKSNRC